MSNISNTNKDIQKMLDKMEINSIDNLFEIIPDKFKYDINNIKTVQDSLSEQELDKYMSNISNQNLHSLNSLSFMGGGSYDHYVPRVVDTLSSRSEFYTAYTPYQPEVSQGTLQYLYEFQTMLCELSGMEIANASLYDCASAIAEACSMSVSITRKKKILLSSMLHPNYIDVVKTYFSQRNIDIELLGSSDGFTVYNNINEIDEYACIVIQSPNYFGLIEDIENISKIKNKSLLVCVSDPISISLLKSPGDCGADVYVGEGQPLGNYISLGGPYIGIFATKLKFARKMPGRIIGKTHDIDGKDGYVMTLQTREQHIRRDRATSNICTNQGLLALRCTIYLALLGKHGVSDIAKLCYNNAQYAASQIDNLNNFNLFSSSKAFIKEFVIQTTFSAKEIQRKAVECNILIDLPVNDKTDSLILLAFTEKRSKEDIDQLINFLSQYK